MTAGFLPEVTGACHEIFKLALPLHNAEQTKSLFKTTSERTNVRREEVKNEALHFEILSRSEEAPLKSSALTGERIVS